MDKVIMAIVMLLVILAFFLIMRQIYLTAEPNPVDQSGKGMLSQLLGWLPAHGKTMAMHAPVLYYLVPGEKKAGVVELKYARTTIGRGSGCDVVLNHPTVSEKHAEIYLAVKKGIRFFVLKNHSRINPVEFYDTLSGDRPSFRMIENSIPLRAGENYFYLGEVRVKVVIKDFRDETVHDDFEEDFRGNSRDKTAGAADREDFSAKEESYKNHFAAGMNERGEDVVREEYEQKIRRSRKTSRIL